MLWDEDSSPDILVFALMLLLFVAVWGVHFSRWRRRNEAFVALAEKYRLRGGSVGMEPPDPGIQGIIMPAWYSRCLVGEIEGVPVAVFDFQIGFGRRVRRGTCVGVKRLVFDGPGTRGSGVRGPGVRAGLRAGLRRNMVIKVCRGWTFVYTDPIPLWGSGRRLKPEEVEELWRRLLRAPGPGCSVGQDGAVAAGPEASRVGEVHIRPVHPDGQA